MWLFVLATLLPVPLLVAGSALGGFWALAALLCLTVFTFLLDEFIEYAGDEVQPGAVDLAAVDKLSVILAVAHFTLLLLAVWTISGGTGIGWGARLALFLAFGLFFGQVSNSNAHELIHRNDKRLFRLGMWVYISLLFGHHTSAHRHVHHRFVATADDPATAAAGESFYDFAPHAWWGGFIAGHEIETAMRRRAGRRGLPPYAIYLAGSALWVVGMTWLFGAGGLVAYLLLVAYAQMQLLLSDYVQHYGLVRRQLPGGQPEPAGPGHSWNAPHWYSSHLMLNAPRHSLHHAHPARPYPALTLPEPGTAPTLPFSLPAMAAIALFPPLWRRIMDRQLADWQARAPAPAAGIQPEPADRPEPVASPKADVPADAAPKTSAAADVAVVSPDEAPQTHAEQASADLAAAVARTVATANSDSDAPSPRPRSRADDLPPISPCQYSRNGMFSRAWCKVLHL